MNVEQAESRYPQAGKYVDGLLVRDHVPNLSSIDGEFEESETLRGVRTVPMSDFGGPRTVLYATDDFERSERLARAIDASEEINPLIVGVDAEGPFLIEGAHRFVALCYLKKKEFPAIVVVEEPVSRPNPVTRRHMSEFDPATVPEGTVIWLQGARTEDLEAFLDVLDERGLDMVHVGPGDRYKVTQWKEVPMVYLENPRSKRSPELFDYSSKVSVGGGQLSPWEATAAVAGVTIVLAALAYWSIKSSVAAVVPTAPVPAPGPVQPVPVPPGSPGY